MPEAPVWSTDKVVVPQAVRIDFRVVRVLNINALQGSAQSERLKPHETGVASNRRVLNISIDVVRKRGF